MDAQSPAPEPRADREAPAARRGAVIARLRQAIYAGREVEPPRDYTPLERVQAVELLGRFPDAEAARLLRDLLLDGEREIGGEIGRRLRDTALLTLLRPNRVAPAAARAILARAFSFWRRPLPWQWSAVYGDLPLLSRYGRFWTFFFAFWLWPLLMLAPAPATLVWQLANPKPLVMGGGLDGTALLQSAVVVGTGLEVYMCHQVLMAALVAYLGPPLRTRGSIAFGRKAWTWAAALTAALLLAGGLLAPFVVVLATGEATVRGSTGGLVAAIAALVLPVLLPAIYMLAHDLRLAGHYLPSRGYRGARFVASISTAVTLPAYILLPLTPAAAVMTWGLGPERFAWLIACYLIYSFLPPVLWVLLLRKLSGSPEGSSRERGAAL